MKIVQRRFALVAVLVAIVESLLGVSAFGIAFGSADGGGHVPIWLNVAVDVLAVPGIYLSSALMSGLGDPGSIVVGFGIGGLLWGCVIATVVEFCRGRSSCLC